ncbi:PREDICTED: uncharacterized protein LOC109329166 isoform X2 [Lupinus angustifolius]|uniref:uncharacterized protein LOC109329166 isoform X2 n=1 Tax=Lupinus angustifolius TaxID=3871 RepID=UPI00092E653B|nr:PREDICTED: uncharacterized protein LOC109329166 isoform X2 [Lupinus angustifolius]
MTQLLLLSKKDGTDSGDIDLPLCLSCMRGLGMRLQRSKGSQCPQMRGFTVLMMMENIRTMDRAIEAKGIGKFQLQAIITFSWLWPRETNGMTIRDIINTFLGEDHIQ